MADPAAAQAKEPRVKLGKYKVRVACACSMCVHQLGLRLHGEFSERHCTLQPCRAAAAGLERGPWLATDPRRAGSAPRRAARAQKNTKGEISYKHVKANQLMAAMQVGFRALLKQQHDASAGGAAETTAHDFDVSRKQSFPKYAR